MDEFDNFDEFDEFGKFDRERLNKLFEEKMADDEFRTRFFGAVGGYQRDFDRIMKMLYGMSKPPEGQQPPQSKSKTNWNEIFKGFDLPSNSEDGWNTQRWESPDGETSFTSFSRLIEPNDEWFNVFPTAGQKLPDGYVLNMLEDKLSTALEVEDYEEAATLRDTIKELKEGDSENK